MRNNSRASLVWLWLSLAVVALDQVSKYWVTQHFYYDEIYRLLPSLNITLRYNSGAAFSFLGNQAGWQIGFFLGVALTIVVIFSVWLARIPRHDYFLSIPVALIIGGALGNAIDRVRYGFVIDFIDFYIKDWHFATFNLADTAISIAAGLLFVRFVLMRR